MPVNIIALEPQYITHNSMLLRGEVEDDGGYDLTVYFDAFDGVSGTSEIVSPNGTFNTGDIFTYYLEGLKKDTLYSITAITQVEGNIYGDVLFPSPRTIATEKYYAIWDSLKGKTGYQQLSWD